MLSSLSSSPYYPVWSFGPLGLVAVLYTVVLHFWRWILACFGSLDNRQDSQDRDATTTTTTTTTSGQVAIVTGSNTGIGYETARTLVLKHEMVVILACRSRDKAEQAIQSIQKEQKATTTTTTTKGKAVFVHPLDLSSWSSIREFAEQVQRQYPVVHVLINNAGRNTTGQSQETIPNHDNNKSRDDPHPDAPLDLLFQSNFLGHYLLTAELVERQVLADQARVVNLSSVMHHYCGDGRLHEAAYWRSRAMYQPGNYAYSASKLAAVLFTVELNRRYNTNNKQRRIQAIAVNPGAVNSDIWRDFPIFIQRMQSILYISSAQGCQTSVAAAVGPWKKEEKDYCPYYQPYAVTWNPSQPAFPPFEMLGPFVGPRRTVARLPADGGLEAAASLWQVSQEITGAKWE